MNVIQFPKRSKPGEVIRIADLVKPTEADIATFRRQFGWRLSQVRNAIGLDTRRAAKIMRIGAKTLERWEAGHRGYGVTQAIGFLLREYPNIRTDWLVAGEGTEMFRERLVMS